MVVDNAQDRQAFHSSSCADCPANSMRAKIAAGALSLARA